MKIERYIIYIIFFIILVIDVGDIIFKELMDFEKFVKIELAFFTIAVVSLIYCILKMNSRIKYMGEDVRVVKSKIKKPLIYHSRPDVYKLGTDIASKAEKRVVLLARSLILILGPRPYLSEYPEPYEKIHYETLIKTVESAKKGEKIFYCGYIQELTKRELNINPGIKDVVKKRLEDLYRNNNEQSKFKLWTTGSDFKPILAFIVGDDHFAIWFNDPGNPATYVCISAEDPIIALALIHIFEQQCKETSLEDAKTELELNPVM